MTRELTSHKVNDLNDERFYIDERPAERGACHVAGD